MKKFRKIMAVLVAAVMIVAMAVPAWAAANTGRMDAGDTGSITVKNAQDGETYHAYKIFDLISFSDGTGTDNAANNHGTDLYSYGLKKNSLWTDFFDNSRRSGAAVWGSDYITIDTSLPMTVNGNVYYPLKLTELGKTLTTDETTRATSIGGVTSATGVQKFAQAAAAYVISKPVNADYYTITASTNDTSGSDTTTGVSASGVGNAFVDVKFEEIPLGYYLVDSSVGTLCALDTTNTDVDVIEKNDIPQLDKKVLLKTAYDTDSDKRNNTTNRYPAAGQWVSDTDRAIGADVKFLLTITVPKYSKKLTLYDVMEEGFDAYTDLKVFGTDPSTPANLKAATADVDYVVKENSGGSDLKIEFTDTYLLALSAVSTETAEIQVEYKTKLNANAEIYGETKSTVATETAISPIEGDPAVLVASAVGQVKSVRDSDGKNDNYSILTYGVGSSTAWSNATVTTYQLDIIKYIADNSLLAGATFQVYDNDVVTTTGETGVTLIDATNTETPLEFVAAATDASDNTGSNYYALPDASQSAAARATLTSETGKKINLRGLAAGTYWIEESYAPSGYDKIPGLIKVVIADNTGTEGQLTLTYSTSPASSPSTVAWKGGITNSKYTTGGVGVLNKTSVELPSTGGMGTTVLYIVGGMLVVLAGAYLFFSRKRTA